MLIAETKPDGPNKAKDSSKKAIGLADWGTSSQFILQKKL